MSDPTDEDEEPRPSESDDSNGTDEQPRVEDSTTPAEESSEPTESSSSDHEDEEPDPASEESSEPQSDDGSPSRESADAPPHLADKERLSEAPSSHDTAPSSDSGPSEDVPAPSDVDRPDDPRVEETDTSSDSGGFLEGPPDDVEQPLTAHINEMVARLGVVAVVLAVATAVVFPISDEIISFLWESFFPPWASPSQRLFDLGRGLIDAPRNTTTVEGLRTVCNPTQNTTATVTCPRVYGPLEYKLTQIKVSSLAGFLVAIPALVYETYLFMRPGLYEKERKYYLATIPISLILAGVGMVVAYFVVLPLLFNYFLGYTEAAANPAFGLERVFNLIVLLMGNLALVFQIPLLIILAVFMNLVTREWLASMRIIFWGLFLTVSFLFSPDPTGMAPIIVATIMVALFEGTLLLLRWSGR